MSLQIYFEGIDALPSHEVERDVETFFKTIRLDGCEYDKAIISEVEHGKFLSNEKFVDRFGVVLRRECLSTGTKIALSLYHAPDSVIWGIEMGRNGLAAVVKHCRVGLLLLEASNYYVECDIDDVPVDVICKGKHYTSLDKFAEYMMEDAPYDS